MDTDVKEFPANAEAFQYLEAFSRNIGWLTPDEQNLLRHRRVAIAGAGGVGGSHLLTLTRLGIGAFNIADFDTFELANFNRQAGADMTSLGREKISVMAEKALSINPTLNLRIYTQGVTEDNIDEFLSGVDIYVDSLDFFALDIRSIIFAECYRRGIPAITAAPLGFSTAVLCFLPGETSFEDYFQLNGHSQEEKAIRFFVGLAPRATQSKYLVYPQSLNLAEKRGPSTGAACEICAGVTAAQATKILLRRGKVMRAPEGFQYDAYTDRLVRTWIPGGNKHPLQRLKIHLVRNKLKSAKPGASTVTTTAEISECDTPLMQILDIARWAPSGDNMQSWRFEIIGDRELIIHGKDTRDHCVYDLQGHATQIAIGTLLESIAIAATQWGYATEARRLTNYPENDPTFAVSFTPDASITRNPLIDQIKQRATQRRPMPGRALLEHEEKSLAAAVPAPFKLLWLSSFSERLRAAKLLFANAGIRLTIPEAYATHSTIIDWGKQFSEDKIPDQAVGLDPVALGLMRWAMQDWKRVCWMNKYLSGTLLPRIQLDFLPGLLCSAHFLIFLDPSFARWNEMYVEAGRTWQRFWLTATHLGLWSQPEMTPVIFSEYVRNNVAFTGDKIALEKARRLADAWKGFAGESVFDNAIVMGRIGVGPAPKARSTRLPLDKLIYEAGN